MVRLHPGPLATCPDTPTGRATRLKPECLQVRLLLWVLTKQRLGRQLADHLGLEPGMLWVRPPPEPLQHITSSQSSPECSPPCHGGDRGFKSHRGRLKTWHGTPTGRAAKLKPWCLWVRLPPVLLKTCVGWALAGPAGRNPDVLTDLGGSTPSRRTSTTENTVTWCNLAARWIVYPLVRVQIPSSSLKRNDSWRGAMMVLLRGFQSRLRGFDSRPRH